MPEGLVSLRVVGGNRFDSLVEFFRLGQFARADQESGPQNPRQERAGVQFGGLTDLGLGFSQFALCEMELP